MVHICELQLCQFPDHYLIQEMDTRPSAQFTFKQYTTRLLVNCADRFQTEEVKQPLWPIGCAVIQWLRAPLLANGKPLAKRINQASKDDHNSLLCIALGWKRSAVGCVFPDSVHIYPLLRPVLVQTLVMLQSDHYNN